MSKLVSKKDLKYFNSYRLEKMEQLEDMKEKFDTFKTVVANNNDLYKFKGMTPKDLEGIFFSVLAYKSMKNAICPHLKVGAAVVGMNEYRNIVGLGTGSNRPAVPYDTGNQDFTKGLMVEGHNRGTIHAEMEASVNFLHNQMDYAKDITAYVTFKPCFNCLQTMISYGINHVVVLSTKMLGESNQSDEMYSKNENRELSKEEQSKIEIYRENLIADSGTEVEELKMSSGLFFGYDNYMKIYNENMTLEKVDRFIRNQDKMVMINLGVLAGYLINK